MCSYDEIYQRAVSGVPVFFKFCDGLDPLHMKQRYQAGLLVFCTKDRGYQQGKSGQTYLKVCSAQQEKDFLPAFHKGRKEYLISYLNERKEREGVRSDALNQALLRESNASRAYGSIPALQVCRPMNVYNERTKKDELKAVCSEPSYIQNQRENLYTSLSSAQGQAQQAYRELEAVRSEIQWANQELTIIPEAQ